MKYNRKLATKTDIENMYNELDEAEKPENIQQKERKKKKAIITNIIYTIVILLLVAALVTILYAKRTGNTPSIFGYSVYKIETGSMDPTLPIGSIIISERINEDEASALAEDTIVTFRESDNTLITHRIVNVMKDDDGKICYNTKGDNPLNSIDKDILYPEDIESVFLLKVPYI